MIPSCPPGFEATQLPTGNWFCRALSAGTLPTGTDGTAPPIFEPGFPVTPEPPIYEPPQTAPSPPPVPPQGDILPYGLIGGISETAPELQTISQNIVQIDALVAPVTGTFTSSLSQAVSTGTATEEQAREYVVSNAAEIAAFYGVTEEYVKQNPDVYAP